MELKDIVEALIFAYPEPISAKALARAIRVKAEDGEEEEDEPFVKVNATQVEKAIEELNADYEETGRTYRVQEGPGGWRMYTQPEYADWIRAMFPGQKPVKLSPPALETLAIIAYRQPITKADIEAIRGVSVDGVLQKVMDRGLVHIAGRADLPGRPLLYGTTDLFRDHFGIKDMDDLPNAGELRAMKLPSADGEEKSAVDAEKQLVLSASDEPASEQQALAINVEEAPPEPDPKPEPEPEIEAEPEPETPAEESAELGLDD